MAEAVINLKSRTVGTHSRITTLRNAKQVPVVVYMRGTETRALSLDIHEYEMIARGHNRNQVLTAVIDGDTASARKVVVRDIQRDKVKGTLQHIDFMGLDDSRKIKIKVPIRFTGEAYGVKTEGGVLQHVLRKVLIETVPARIPEHIDVDVTEYKKGQPIYVREIKAPEYTMLTPGNQVVGTIKGTKTIEEEEAEAAAVAAAAAAAAGEVPAEGAVSAEGAAVAPGAPGAAPAAGAAPGAAPAAGAKPGAAPAAGAKPAAAPAAKGKSDKK